MGLGILETGRGDSVPGMGNCIYCEESAWNTDWIQGHHLCLTMVPDPLNTLLIRG